MGSEQVIALSPDQEAMLVDFFAYGDLVQLAEDAGLTLVQLVEAAHQLGLTRYAEMRSWPADDRAVLIAAYPVLNTRRLAHVMGRPFSALRSYATRGNVKKQEGKHKWSQDDIDLVIEQYATGDLGKLAERIGCSVNSIYQHAVRLGLQRSDSVIAEQARQHANRNPALIANRIKKGNVPANKGKKMPPYVYAKAKGTMFKKGRVSNTWQPVGTEVTDPDGYIKRKISDRKDIPAQRNWRLVHHLEWEAHHGAIPNGHVVRFRDGNKGNTTIENLELISLKENRHRNSIHFLPPELATAARTIGRIKRIINKRSDHGTEQDQ